MKVTSTETPIRERGATIDTRLRLDPGNRPSALPHTPKLETLVELAPTVVATTGDRHALVEALAGHNEIIGNPAGSRLARRLEDPHAVVVITGQQPWVLGGPMMLFAKITGAVRLATLLEEQLGHPVVPIFWNHSEDHDLDEVNRWFTVRDGEVALEHLPYDHEGQPLETLIVSEAAAAAAQGWLSDDLKALGPHVGERHAAWASRVITELMPTVAVVHAEPSLLRPFQGPVFSDMIRQHEDLVAAVRTQSAELQEGGDVPQVEVNDASLLFRFDDQGRRVRAIVGSETMQEAASKPQRFSCSVLARAVAQQAVLPIVAHVNGPAENAYFAQLRGVFDVMGVAIPACWPRPSVTFADPHQVSVSERLGIERRKLAADTSTWPGPPETSHSTTFDELQASFAERLAALRSTTSDDGLRRGVDGFAKRVDDGLAKLRRSFDKQAERSGGIGRGARRRLAEIMRPRGRPQERVLGPIVLLKRAPRLTGEILLQLDPLDFRHHVVTLEDQDFLVAEVVKDSQP